MPTAIWNENELSGFQEAAQSLRLYRRADLTDPEHGDSLIESLYVDPLPADQALKTMLRPNTTFVIGRKGTGKSTIFQRLQYELRKSKLHTSAYIDIKTLYELSLIHISEPTRLGMISYAVFCLKKKKKK